MVTMIPCVAQVTARIMANVLKDEKDGHIMYRPVLGGQSPRVYVLTNMSSCDDDNAANFVDN